MIDVLKDFYEAISVIDLIYLIITILSLITCYKKGFVLSILSMAKWLLAYVITLILFPRIKPYFKNVIDNEYVLDVGLGIIIFIIVMIITSIVIIICIIIIIIIIIIISIIIIIINSMVIVSIFVVFSFGGL